MTKESRVLEPVVTKVPLTAEAREDMLQAMFADALPHYGELFIPDDKFYINQRGPGQAQSMVAALCHWLGIKPGYIGLEFEGAGGQTADGQRHTIYLETTVLWDEFLLGAALARALTRYLIEERKQVLLPSADQPALLAAGSIVFGLGLVVLNGPLPQKNWLGYVKQKISRSTTINTFNHNFEADYEYELQGFIKTRGLSVNAYSHCLTPWAAKKLGVKTPHRSTHAVREAKHKQKLAHIKLAGIAWLSVLVLGISCLALYNRSRPPSVRSSEAEAHAGLLLQLVKECEDSLAYQKQYADLTDIQTVRNLNGVNLRCQSLDNQYQAAQQALGQ